MLGQTDGTQVAEFSNSSHPSSLSLTYLHTIHTYIPTMDLDPVEYPVNSPQWRREITRLKAEKPDRYKPKQWEEARRRGPSEWRWEAPVLLRGLFDTPEKIQEHAGLSEVPKVQSAQTVPDSLIHPADKLETVQYCMVDGNGYCRLRERYQNIKLTTLLIDGENRASHIFYP